jgi:murein DD-endopeptidase MepM/ murein hydrolase activator NlpD
MRRRNRASALLAAVLLGAPAAASAGMAEQRDPMGRAILTYGDGTPPPAPKSVFPVAGPVGYGESGAQFGADRGGRMHEGQDVFAPTGTPLLAVADGQVVETGNDGGRGNYVAIHGTRTGRTYVYLPMSEPSRVATGERVRAGQRVGSLGCTGSCFGPHLHFEVREGRGTQGPPVDPRPFLLRRRR